MGRKEFSEEGGYGQFEATPCLYLPVGFGAFTLPGSARAVKLNKHLNRALVLTDGSGRSAPARGDAAAPVGGASRRPPLDRLRDHLNFLVGYQKNIPSKFRPISMTWNCV